MKIFLAGATGVIGRRAVDRLVDRGHQVTALARSRAKADQLRAAGATPATADLFDPPALRDAVAGHQVVINLATHIPPTRQVARQKAWAENDHVRREGSANLVDAAIANRAARYLQESFGPLYADHGDRWISEDEPHVATPFTPAVDAAEANTTRFTEHGGAGVVLRFGMFLAPESGQVIDMIKVARRGWMPVPGAADSYLSMIHADDAADAVVAALHLPAGIYNVVDDEPMTRAEVADELAAAVGRTRLHLMPGFVNRLVATRVPQMVTSQRISNARLKGAGDWRPAHPTLDDDVAELAAAAGIGR
jgi:nucleoside-diphosphate-sugar epimerase